MKKNGYEKLKTQLSSIVLEIPGLRKINLVSRFVASKGNIFESFDCQNKNIQILLLTKNKGLKTKK